MPIRWKLHNVMAKKRMRNKDLAIALKITENSIYRLRKANDMPRLTPERLEGICAALGCQPGDLLEWVPEQVPLPNSLLRYETLANQESPTHQLNSVLVQPSLQSSMTVSAQALQHLTQYCFPILALAWRGFVEYGPGAVIFTDLPAGPKLAYIERDHLDDQNCIEAIDQSNPEMAAVVLYYRDADYSTSHYSILTLTGPKSPPECFALSYKSDQG